MSDALIDFASVYMYQQYGKSYDVLPWHNLISEKLQNVFFKKNNKNLIICMPPRFGKSELGIRIFISWCFSIVPDCNFIVASSTLDLARSHVNAIKNALKSNWYRRCFPYGAHMEDEVHNDYFDKKYKKKSSARSDFIQTLEGGEVKAVGLGGQITGFGAGKKRHLEESDIFGGCIICDDLLKEQDFRSETQRDIVYNWFKSTITSRVNTADTPIILIMQRLHEDDIVGRLLKEEPELWDTITVPAFDEINKKSVWEQAISTTRLLNLVNSQAPLDQHMFYSKYQQEPRSDIVATIKPTWWMYYNSFSDIKSQITTRFITMDTAYKAKTYNDESVCALWGFDDEGQNAYLLDMIHGRWEFPELLEHTRNFYNKHNIYINNKKLGYLYIEDKASGTSLAQTLKREGMPAKLWLPNKNEPTDKMSRVLEATRYIANGRVFLNSNATYVKDFIKQCASFTGDDSVHDDMVDAMTMALMIWRNTLAK